MNLPSSRRPRPLVRSLRSRRFPACPRGRSRWSNWATSGAPIAINKTLSATSWTTGDGVETVITNEASSIDDAIKYAGKIKSGSCEAAVKSGRGNRYEYDVKEMEVVDEIIAR